MTKKNAIKRSAASGRYVTKPIGASKAAKFSKVEGLVLKRKSVKTLKQHKSSGLKGDALRSAITGSFKSNKRK